MRKWIIALSISVLTIVGFIASAIAVNNQDNNASTPDKWKQLGIEAIDTNESIKLDKDAAIARAKEIAGTVYSNQAKSITAVQKRFTDHQVPKLPESNIVPKDLSVWIVTLHGVQMESHGGFGMNSKNRVAQLNVVIDANTGEEIEMFAHE